jgi:hypothetical protein
MRKIRIPTGQSIRTIIRYLTAVAVLASLALFVNFISTTTASGTAGLPNLSLPVEKIVAHRDFFVRFDGYDGDFLCDVNDGLGENRIGLLLLESSGFLKSLVFDRGTLEKIHESASIPAKNLRNELAQSGILVSDARLIAGRIAGLKTGDRAKRAVKRRPHRETARREVMPQSLPEGFSPVSAARKPANLEKALERMRNEVEQNPELAAMKSSEILERFRSDVAHKSASQKGETR